MVGYNNIVNLQRINFGFLKEEERGVRIIIRFFWARHGQNKVLEFHIF